MLINSCEILICKLLFAKNKFQEKFCAAGIKGEIQLTFDVNLFLQVQFLVQQYYEQNVSM